MKKPLIIFLLCVVIAATFGFAAIKIFAVGDSDNWFNKTYRAQFARYPVLRSLFGLHFDGDGQSDYLGGRYSEIIIEVDAMQGVNPSWDNLNRFAAKVGELTGKPTKLIVSDQNIPATATVSVDGLNSLTGQYRDRKNSNTAAALYVIVLTQDADEPTLLGTTSNEFALAIYSGGVAEFTRNNPELFSNYFYSTILHEFGHQIGLSHNRDFGCLMNDHADGYDLIYADPKDVVTEYCAREKQELEQIKSRF